MQSKESAGTAVLKPYKGFIFLSLLFLDRKIGIQQLNSTVLQ